MPSPHLFTVVWSRQKRRATLNLWTSLWMQSQKHPVGSWQWASQTHASSAFCDIFCFCCIFTLCPCSCLSGSASQYQSDKNQDELDPLKRAWQLNKEAKTILLQQQPSLTAIKSDPGYCWNCENTAHANVFSTFPPVAYNVTCEVVVSVLLFCCCCCCFLYTHKRMQSWGFT